MADLQGTVVLAGIVPSSTEDQYPTHDPTYGKGGWRKVATMLERNTIPRLRLEEGMVVYVAETGKNYQLKTLGVNALADVWEELRTGVVRLTGVEYNNLPVKDGKTIYLVTDAEDVVKFMYAGDKLIAMDGQSPQAFPYNFPIIF